MASTEETGEHQTYDTKTQLDSSTPVHIQLVCSKNKQLIKRAKEYCVNINVDHYMTGM